MTRWLRAGGLALAVAAALAPFYWMTLISLTDTSEMVTYANPWLPAPESTLRNYGTLLTSAAFGRWLLNTLLVTGGTVLVALAASLAAALGLARLRARPARTLLALLLGTYALPQTVLALPLLVMISGLHLANTQLALLLAYPGLVIPFGTWVLWRTISEDRPREILEQARLEGARGLALVRSVLLPLAAPALVATAIFGVVVVFSDYLYLFTLVSGESETTLMGAVESTNVDLENPGYDFAVMLLGIGPLALAVAWLAERYAGALVGGRAE